MVTEADLAFAMKNYDLEARTDGKGYIVTAQPGNHPMASGFQKIQWPNNLSYKKIIFIIFFLSSFLFALGKGLFEPGVCE